MVRPAVDVVVLTWNDGELLANAVESALASEGVDVALFVVDNGSDPPAQVVSDPRVSLIRSDVNLGVSRGRNRGVSAGSAPVVCLLDSDAALHPDTLANLLHVASAADVGLVGPVYTGQRPEDSGGLAPTFGRKVARLVGRTSSYEAVSRANATCWDVDFVIGACQLFKRQAFEDVGGIDERWFYGPEDADFCMRLRNAGWRVVQTSHGVCDHPPRRRNRRILSRRGLAHAKAVAEFLWRHRRYRGVNG